MFTNKKYIIFDMDGTLIDSIGIWNEVDKILIAQIRTDGKDGIDSLLSKRNAILHAADKTKNPYREYCAYLKEEYGSTLSVDDTHNLRYEIAQHYLTHTIDYKKDADRLIRKLKSLGFTLAIATTTYRNTMDIYRTENKNIISKANIDDYFSLVYTREDAKFIKPHPEIYLRVMETLKASPEECLIFEDSLIGMEAAKAAGVETVAVYDSYSDEERDQINALSNYQIASYEELLNSSFLN